ncbi:MAG: pyridoxal phosphate-dependent aminotransferase [Theionarchaea archaeon]|nr:pyridoxal phosphate-dependent aminotransferase [Theionarchaea archaeon]MBU6999320.1 pyridoxal phosphate-dependent aminotransferase [Theionarchaea archaeon]MBU7019555.1 pyridoxal phosphate-dependent aminotransferase [Theionarchaea archaeon]MBU7033733.1 pyridoxal phosphate-dependent aminotransferase [Theionarchaea archaeon]MBU7039457.1 pyridoxal phosphate-dependent aminotransferase [Theionarchaea archaeon]
MRTMYDYIEKIRQYNPEIRLDIGQPDLAVDQRVIEATVEALRAGKTRYTSAYGITPLREALAEIHNVSTDQVLITVGGKLPIYAATYLCNKAAVIHPGWPAYEENLEFLKKPYHTIHTTFEDKFSPSFESLDSTFDLMFTNYPNNPTGTILAPSKMKELVDLCNDYHITLLADEIYSFLVYDDFVSFTEFDCEDLIYIGSFSKRFSMTGYRLGYVISSSEWIRRLEDFQVHTITCSVEFAQWAALKALTLRDETDRKAKEIYLKRKKVVEKGLADNGIPFVPCQGAFYLFPKIPVNSELFGEELLKEGVSVIPGVFFGDYRNHFRLSLVSDRMEEAINRMKTVLERLT